MKTAIFVTTSILIILILISKLIDRMRINTKKDLESYLRLYELNVASGLIELLKLGAIGIDGILILKVIVGIIL